MKKIIILSGDKGQGKSSLLKEIFSNRKDVNGLITLRREADLRDFYLLHTGESWSMQGEVDYRGPWLEVGRFRFSAEAFRRAEEWLLKEARNPEIKLLIIDEIGPLELRGKGFSNVLRTIMDFPSGPGLLLVVRSGMVDEVLQHFSFSDVQVETCESLWNALAH